MVAIQAQTEMDVHLTAREIARRIDLSAVHAEDGDAAVRALVERAKRYGCGLVTVLPSNTSLAKELVRDAPEIRVGGNVGFPSGASTTSIKVAETKELVAFGCDELDVVLNIGRLISGRDDEVLQDLEQVVTAAQGRAVKVILECHYLNPGQIERGCELSIRAGAAFVKTGTGWAPTGATLENVRLIKSIVGERIGIKASGGIRDLDNLLALYRAGARRFGLGLRSGEPVLRQLAAVQDVEFRMTP